MPSTYSDLLRIEKMATGEKTSTWGTVANAQFELLEEAITGLASVTHDDSANYTLTAYNGLTDEARCLILEVGGTLTAARNVVCPAFSKFYIVKNGTSGGFAFTLKTSGGTGISVANGTTALLYCDGTNVVNGINALPSGTTLGGVAVVDLSSAQTLTNKVINSASNTLTVNLSTATLTGTTAQFNTALSDGSFATLAGSETLTNKTLTTPTLVLADAAGSAPTADGEIKFDRTGENLEVGDGSTTKIFSHDGGTATLTGKTINLTSNTLTGTTAQFNTALSDGSFATLAGSETLTNKILTSPTVNTPTLVLANAAGAAPTADGEIKFDRTGENLEVGDGSTTKIFSHDGGTATLTGKTINLTSNTLTGTTAQFNTALSDGSFATLAGSETLTNKTLTTPIISTISNSGTVTLPTGTVTLVARDTTDTLTNKTLTSPTITGPTVTGTMAAAAATFSGTAEFNGTAQLDAAVTMTNAVLTSGTSVALSMTGANKKTLTLDHNATITVSGEVANQSVVVYIKQGSTGGTAAWSGVDQWVGGSAPTLSTTAGERDIIVLETSEDGSPAVIGSHVGVAY